MRTNTILEIRGPSANNEAGVLIRKVDGTVGLDLWVDPAVAYVSIDSRWDNPADKMRFRMRTAGTPVEVMTLTPVGVGIGTAQ